MVFQHRDKHLEMVHTNYNRTIGIYHCIKWAGIHAPAAHVAIIMHTRLAFNDLFPHMKIYPEYSAKFSLKLGLYQNKYALW